VGPTPELASISVEEFESRRRDRLSATADHRAAADRIIDLYRAEGLLPDGYDEALFCCCPHRDRCWKGAPRPEKEQDAGVAFPWIGTRYFDSRVVVLGLNLNNFGGLDGNFLMCLGHVEAMREGKPGKAGRQFARGAMKYLRVILASLDGEDLPAANADIANQDLAALWERCAFLERVKCAPGNARATPTEAMIWECPLFLAAKELEILAPRVILHLGRSNLRREWLVQEDGYGQERIPHMERDKATIGGRSVELISVNHPSGWANRVAASLEQLIFSLAERHQPDPGVLPPGNRPRRAGVQPCRADRPA
jgi:hypothetical protein